MTDKRSSMTRCDALQWAAHQLLEQFRPLLDSTANIKSVQLDLRIRPDGTVHTQVLQPSFEAHVGGRPDICKYDFGKAP